MIRTVALLGLILAIAKPVHAEPPRIVTDIAPVHSLVAMVMQGVGAPEVLIRSGVSPHDFALRPSDARNLAQADAVIWVSDDLTPGLARSIESLAGNAQHLELLETPGTFTMPYRTGVVFSHDDDHDAHDHDADAHDADKEHKDHGHHDHKADDHSDHKEHDHAEHKNEGHSEHADHGHHGSVDVHAWQDPLNAKAWLAAIANLLSRLDPENAETYHANEHAASDRIDAATARLKLELEPFHDRAFVVTHDAFHYFENRFDIRAMAAISAGDATQASAARLQAISRTLDSDQTICIFIEPQMSQALAQTFASEHGAKIGVLDPIGATLTEGPELYLNMLEGIASGLRECLS